MFKLLAAIIFLQYLQIIIWEGMNFYISLNISSINYFIVKVTLSAYKEITYKEIWYI